MKLKFLLIVICCLACLAATAQEKNTDKNYHWNIDVFASTPDQITYKPYMDSWIEFYMDKVSAKRKNVICPVMGLSASYYTKKNIGMKIKYGFSLIHLSSSGTWEPDTTIKATFNSSMKQINQQISIGIYKKINYNPLSFYMGIDVLYNSYGKFTLSYYQDIKSYTNGALVDDQILEDNHDVGQGYSVGLAPMAGISLNISKFSIGLECNLPFMYRCFNKDDTEYGKTTDVITGTVTEGKPLITDTHYKNIYSNNLKGVIHFSFGF